LNATSAITGDRKLYNEIVSAQVLMHYQRLINYTRIRFIFINRIEFVISIPIKEV